MMMISVVIDIISSTVGSSSKKTDTASNFQIHAQRISVGYSMELKFNCCRAVL